MNKLQLKQIIKECISEVIQENGLQEPIIPIALEIIRSNPRAVKITDKGGFASTLKQQKYFSLRYSHAYYSKEDYELAHKGDSKFRDGSRGISEADKGAIIAKDAGDLVAVWSPRDNIGYIVPSN